MLLTTFYYTEMDIRVLGALFKSMNEKKERKNTKKKIIYIHLIIHKSIVIISCESKHAGNYFPIGYKGPCVTVCLSRKNFQKKVES